MTPLTKLARLWQPERSLHWLVFSFVFAIALAFAAYTEHAWEDYYITYRCSKNLATGHGLVYTVGERVHAFTSPLNVLIPAALSVLTGNRSDELVLWLFRVLSGALFAAAATLLFDSARKNSLSRLATVVLIGMFALDAKTVDFSINGQEIGLMVFFVALALHALTVPSNWTTSKLGLAGAGLMWTRPDGFVYFGALAIGFLVFTSRSGRASSGVRNSRGRSEEQDSRGRLASGAGALGTAATGQPRIGLFKTFLWAGALTSLLYLPWLLWAWHYFGSPVPHTIIAKAQSMAVPGMHPPRSLERCLTFPFILLTGSMSVGATFLPANALMFGGWHWTAVILGKVLGCIGALYWCVPSGRPQGRAVSFAYMLVHFYLSCIAAYAAAWYLPACALLGSFVVAQMVEHGLEFTPALLRPEDPRRRIWQLGVRILPAIVLVSFLLLTASAAWQLRVQQREIEDGTRKQIGLWLREHAASPGDTVFLEPLGYIGYYSQLKMLDTPGLCAPEVVAAEQKLKTTGLAAVIAEVKPDWLVLRPLEAYVIHQTAPRLLTEPYSTTNIFDAAPRLASYRWLPGRGYLRQDEKFIVFKRNGTAASHS